MKGRSLSSSSSSFRGWFRPMFHSPKASWAVLTGAAEQEACWIAAGGTFEQLEDSEERALRMALVRHLVQWVQFRAVVMVVVDGFVSRVPLKTFGVVGLGHEPRRVLTRTNPGKHNPRSVRTPTV